MTQKNRTLAITILMTLSFLSVSNISEAAAAAGAGGDGSDPDKGSLTGGPDEIGKYLQNTTPPLIGENRLSFVSGMNTYIVSKIAAEDREAFVRQVLRLVTPDMGEVDIEDVMSIVSQIPHDKREALITQALKLITPDMRTFQRIAVIDVVSNASQEEGVHFLAQFLKLITPNIDKYSRRAIFRSFSSVAVKNREAFVKQCLELMVGNMYGYQNAEAVKAVSEVEAKDRESYVAQFLRLVTPDMDGTGRVWVIENFSKVAAEDRETFVTQCLRLITPNMRGRGPGDVVASLSRVAPEEWERVVTQSLRLITPDMRGGARGSVVEAVSRVPADERARRVERAVAQLAVDRGEGLMPGTLYLNRMYQLLETPIAHPLPPLRGGMAAVVAAAGGAEAAARQGMNVHAEGRDDKTTRAMRLFMQETNRMGFKTGDTEKYLKEFREFFKTQKDSDKKRKAAMVLGLIPARRFGPLLGRREALRVASNGLDMPAKEFLARVWYYASNYKDDRAEGKPADIKRNQRMAQEDIITALASSVENGNEIVCNPGKLQRIAVNVLQGRLRGVDVDDVVVSCPEDAFNAFLTPRRQDIANPIELEKEADAYLEENSYVDKEAFRKDINRYIITTLLSNFEVDTSADDVPDWRTLPEAEPFLKQSGDSKGSSAAAAGGGGGGKE